MDPICFDAALNDKQKIAGKWFIFGLFGNIADKSTWYPVVCRVDGTIDFGAGYEDDEDRWARTNIREKIIRIGNAVSIWVERDQEFLFYVSKVQVEGVKEMARFHFWTDACVFNRAASSL